MYKNLISESKDRDSKNKKHTDKFHEWIMYNMTHSLIVFIFNGFFILLGKHDALVRKSNYCRRISFILTRKPCMHDCSRARLLTYLMARITSSPRRIPMRNVYNYNGDYSTTKYNWQNNVSSIMHQLAYLQNQPTIRTASMYPAW